jgi:hypothetical protein
VERKPAKFGKPSRQEIAAALAAIRHLAKAPPPTPGVVDLVIAKLDYLTERIPDFELRDLSMSVARHVAELHEPRVGTPVSHTLRVDAALARLEAYLGKVVPGDPEEE